MPVKLKILIIKYLIFLNNMKNKNSDIMLYIIIKYKQNIYIYQLSFHIKWSETLLPYYSFLRIKHHIIMLLQYKTPLFFC